MTLEADFHARRKKKFGASEVAKVMGESPFGNALDVYNYKLGLTDTSLIRNTEAMNRGNRQENFVLTEFAAKHGVEVRNQQLAVTHPEPSLDWAAATLDGVAYRGFTPLGPVEAKTITTGLYIKPPTHYLMQVLWQCWVTGFKEGWLAVWSTKDAKFHDYHIVVADHQELLDQCIETCTRFWHENVLAGVPPQVQPKRQRDNKDDLDNTRLGRYLEISAQIKALEKEREVLKKEIIESLGSPTDMHVENHSYRVDIITVESKGLARKKLTEAHPDLVEQFTEPTYSTRLNVARVGIEI